MFMPSNIKSGKTSRSTQIIKIGYIYKKEYQGNFQYNSEIGLKEREDLINIVKNTIERLSYDSDNIKLHDIKLRGNNFTLIVVLEDQTMYFNFDTINSIVSQNKDRKINQEAYLPFDKSMDKYNSLYVSVESDNVTTKSFDIAEQLISNVMSNISQDIFYFKSLLLRKDMI